MKSSPYQRLVLPSGVRVLLVPMQGVDSVATAVMVGVGSRYERREINGISHFLEHMVFKGTQKFPTTDDVNFIERLGGIQNAYTDIDVTSYHNKVLASDWSSALEINKELALFPRLEEKYLDKERSVIIEEIKRYEDMPELKVEEVFHQMLYPGTRLGMRIIGDEKSLQSVASRELKLYHDAWYQPAKIVVVLAGNLSAGEARETPESFQASPASEAIKRKALAWFGHLEQKKTSDLEVVRPGQSKPQLSVVTKSDAQQAHLVLGVRTFARGSNDRFAWALFNLIMGSSFTSRLFKEIREKRGLCYHIHSDSSNYAEVGSWEIHSGVATDKVGEATKAILAELVKVKNTGITEGELQVAKKRLAAMLAFRSEDPEFFVEWYGRQEVYQMPIITTLGYLEKISQVTREEINLLASKYLKTPNLNLALVWNKPWEEKFATWLQL